MQLPCNKSVSDDATLIMIRTVCCESYKQCGMRCSICPDLPQNMEAAQIQRQQFNGRSLGRRISPEANCSPRG